MSAITYQITVTFTSPADIDDDDDVMEEFVAKVKSRIKNSVFPVVTSGSLKATAGDISEV